MKLPTLTNAPLWPQLSARSRRGFQENWRLKIVEPDGSRALWLKFALLSSTNGFRHVAETWAVSFSRSSGGTRGEVQKSATRQSYEIREAFSPCEDRAGIRIAECELSDRHTRGVVQSKGQLIRWDLEITPAQELAFHWIPEDLSRLGLARTLGLNLGEDLRVSGWSELNGTRTEWNAAPATLSRNAGPRHWHSWAWAHCNAFVDEQGKPAYVLFEGHSARENIAGLLPSLRLSTFFFHYRGKSYRLNSIWNAMRVRSQHTLTEWTFRADAGELSFRGTVSARNRDFAGLTFEDTNGSLLYCSKAELCDMQLSVYRREKLEATFRSPGTTGFEVVGRQRSPYVPTLI